MCWSSYCLLCIVDVTEAVNLWILRCDIALDTMLTMLYSADPMVDLNDPQAPLNYQHMRDPRLNADYMHKTSICISRQSVDTTF